ncbi:alpha/beta fold hydrolase [Myxococcota bacterium]|nr:alpha/beta fold hydrolase [Myxococcota bacterium]
MAPVDAWVPTADGASVALRRYAADGPPVVLVHGISSNHRTWDLDAGRSLARTLQAQGLDAWLLDLRGHGLAQRDAQGKAQRTGWTMDDYGRYDLPAAIDHVRQVTGQDRVGYVGHSMGGMAAAIYVAWHGDQALSSLVVVGSPVDFGHPEPLLQVARAGGPVATIGGTIPTPALARAAALLDRSPLFVDALLFNPDNVSPEARKALYRNIVSPLSRGEVDQLRRMLDDGAFRSADGQVDYRAGLASLRVPLLVIAGRGDSVAPVDRVAPWIEASGSPVEELLVASRANGFRHDYGHLDLAMGDAAPEELYPRIVAWLEAGARRDR